MLLLGKTMKGSIIIIIILLLGVDNYNIISYGCCSILVTVPNYSSKEKFFT